MTVILSNIAKHKWMEDMYTLIADRHLNEIAIPGTHDSGCYDFKWPRAAAGNTQALSIGKQLELGARYLDLRFTPSGDSFKIHHDIITDDDVTLEVVFAEIKNFLEQNSKEILIIHLSHFKEFDDYNIRHEFFQRVWSYIEKYTNKKTIDRSLVIKEMIQSGQRVYISVDQRDNIPQKFQPYIWENIDSPYDEPIHQTGDANKVIDHLYKLANEKKQSKLWVLQGVMTLTTVRVIFGGHAIKDYASSINASLMQKLPSWKGIFNIFLCDFISAGLVDIALVINGAHRDQLSAGGILFPDDEIVSANAKVKLIYQSDGNLVVYENINGKDVARHASDSNGQTAGLAYFDSEFIGLYHSINDYIGQFLSTPLLLRLSPYKKIGISDRDTGAFPETNRVVVQDDCNVVNYSRDRRVIWDWKRG